MGRGAEDAARRHGLDPGDRWIPALAAHQGEGGRVGTVNEFGKIVCLCVGVLGFLCLSVERWTSGKFGSHPSRLSVWFSLDYALL